MNELAGRVTAVFRTWLGRDNVGLGDCFHELGIDSLDALDLRFRLEDEFGCDIPDGRLRDFRCGRDVVTFLEEGGCRADAGRAPLVNRGPVKATSNGAIH